MILLEINMGIRELPFGSSITRFPGLVLTDSEPPLYEVYLFCSLRHTSHTTQPLPLAMLW